MLKYVRISTSCRLGQVFWNMAYVLMSAYDEEAINTLEIPKELEEKITMGIREVCTKIGLLAKNIISKKKVALIGIDGYIGFNWDFFVSKLKEILSNMQIDIVLEDINNAYKSPDEIEEMINPFLFCDPFFGKIFNGSIEDFTDKKRVNSLRHRLKDEKNCGKLVICFGCGSVNSLLEDLYDLVLYIDVTKDKSSKAVIKGFAKNLGDKASVRDSKYKGKRLYYVDFPVLDKHKKTLLKRMDFYLDGNEETAIKIMPREAYKNLLLALSRQPLRLKPIYLEGVWGGQWLKKVRDLPDSMKNCAWSYEVMAPYQSLIIKLRQTTLEIPFLNLLWEYPHEVMGEFNSLEKIGGNFPIRVNYDDSMGGGNMAIQVHGDLSYLNENFGEPIGQNESYYIVAVGPKAKTYLGLRDTVKLEEFYEAARNAEIRGIPFNHDEYVNSIPSQEGILFLIPAGTVHASGRNQVVLEISDTTDLYTFHIYDYLRPDLDGKLRPIHLYHAFKVLDPSKRASWVIENLVSKPQLVRAGDTWAEYFLGELKELGIIIHRLEFLKKIFNNTNGKFHILTLVSGEEISIVADSDPRRKLRLRFSETALVPACIKNYELINLGRSPCKVIKVFMR